LLYSALRMNGFFYPLPLIERVGPELKKYPFAPKTKPCVFETDSPPNRRKIASPVPDPGHAKGAFGEETLARVAAISSNPPAPGRPPAGFLLVQPPGTTAPAFRPR